MQSFALISKQKIHLIITLVKRFLGKIFIKYFFEHFYVFCEKNFSFGNELCLFFMLFVNFIYYRLF
ncbi:hypothetical protein C3V36_01590 [Lachnospiraceae bacterium oral taxon 500]|nr:hypothetical protein C3V36_01590 [Lachnospiraceae bacterium oral taxon 500]